MEWFGLEGILKDRLAPTPYHEQGHLPLDQAAQGPFHPGLEHLHG